MIIKNWKKEILTIPNLLSLFRLALIPVYIIIYLRATEPIHYTIAGSILAVSCLTDLIDGKIARHFHMISTVGKILDPLADKLTQFTLMVCLAIKHPIIWTIAALFFVKEIFQLIAGLIFLRKRKMLSGALFSGKLCTTVLFVSLILLVLTPKLNPTVINWITIIDGVFIAIAFAHYIYTYWKQTSMIQSMDSE